VIEKVARAEILPIRHSVLRPTLPPEAAEYPEDDHPDIFHLAVRDDTDATAAAGRILACITFFPERVDGEPAWRFRGMATIATHRNRGIGGRLLEAGIDDVVRRGGSLVWCNGRDNAAAFYQRHGFVIRGESFELPPVGWHYLFVRELS